VLLAKKFKFQPINRFQPVNNNDNRRKKIIGLALTIHWFGVDKADAVNFLFNKEIENFDISTLAVNFLFNKEIENFDISTLKDENGKKTFIYTPILPNDISKALQLNNASFKNWTSFGKGLLFII